jgi:hypothetical protein
MHRLKDLRSPEHFYQLLVDGLENDHPPLRSLGTASALPAVGSRLLGRDREVHDLVTLSETEEARLVTLTGPGGSGPTRLAALPRAPARRGYFPGPGSGIGAYFISGENFIADTTGWFVAGAPTGPTEPPQGCSARAGPAVRRW